MDFRMVFNFLIFTQYKIYIYIWIL